MRWSSVPVIRSPLDRLGVDDVVALNQEIRDVAEGLDTMADAAQAITGLLHRDLVLDDRSPACALVRLYATVRDRHLPPELHDVVGEVSAEGARRTYLTLLGTAGDVPAWNDRRRSEGHRAIPLDRAAVLAEAAPMVAGLLGQLGIDVDAFLELDPDHARVLNHQEYGIFHVPDAHDSPLIPAQDFVVEHGVHSVIGCGGGLPSGEVFALILFSRAAVDLRTAELFRTVAYGIKSALVPYTFTVFG